MPRSKIRKRVSKPGKRPRRGPIALLSDFGVKDHYAAVMKGVIASIAPSAPIVDVTHQISPQQIFGGALVLRETWRFFPPETIFLAVVDPGVGSARRGVAIETRGGAIFVGPDNGLLWMAAEQAGFVRAVELTNKRYRLSAVSSTFHGRDIFAPAAAWLWSGVRLQEFGPKHEDVVRMEIDPATRVGDSVFGRVTYVDGFGNLVTNVTRQDLGENDVSFPSKNLSVTIENNAPVELYTTYAQAPEGTPLALFGSFGLLEVAVRDGNAAARFSAGVDAKVKVTL